MTFPLRRTLLGRIVIYAAPIFAALLAISVESLSRGILPRRPEFVDTLVLIHAALGAIGSAAGVILLTGRAGLRVAGAVAYAVLSLFIFGFASTILAELAHLMTRP